ncbi:unnamed protein product [Bursaphelenchus xylophilus]|uniref:(pine wood nematode) hypothetical protein n=1 Tax=Bursaphelenchus xylophilus TaxID=6326 RepID=A0A1I7RW27_BURXY|nr:unnamed protein product [Bursaphelenchus xylophilus]CAG9095045.1 unnamed protein product [Bursaphelenchus xylophilus]
MKWVTVVLAVVTAVTAKTAVWTERIHFTDRTYNNLEVIVDLASTDSFLIEGRCENCPFRGINRRFYPEKSSTFEKAGGRFGQKFDEDLNIAQGGISGYIGEDLVGSSKTLRGKFGLVKRLDGTFDPATTLEAERVAGRIGLSLNTSSDMNLLEHYFEGVSRKLVCFAPKCVENSNKVDECQTILFKGQFPVDGYENYTAARVEDSRSGLWQFKVDSFKGPSVQAHSFNAILSTTTPDLVVPKDVYEAFSTHFNVRQDENDRTVDCRHRYETSPVVVTVNRVEMPIQARDLISYDIWTKTCSLRVRPAENLDRNTWIFGSVFTDSVGICLDFDERNINFLKVL